MKMREILREMKKEISSITRLDTKCAYLVAHAIITILMPWVTLCFSSKPLLIHNALTH